MKSIKVLSLLMAALMICCVMVSCGGNNNTNDTTTTTPGANTPTYAAKVSITITDMEGKDIIKVADYNYQSGTTAPTPFAVVDDYCYMTFDESEGMTVTTDDGGRLVSIGKVAAVDGTSFWSITINGKEIASVDFSTEALKDGDALVIKLNPVPAAA